MNLQLQLLSFIYWLFHRKELYFLWVDQVLVHNHRCWQACDTWLGGKQVLVLQHQWLLWNFKSLYLFIKWLEIKQSIITVDTQGNLMFCWLDSVTFEILTFDSVNLAFVVYNSLYFIQLQWNEFHHSSNSHWWSQKVFNDICWFHQW